MKKIFIVFLLLCIPLSSLQAFSTDEKQDTVQNQEATTAKATTKEEKPAPISVIPADDSKLAESIRKGDIELSDLPELFFYWIKMVLSLVGIFAIVMIIIGGLMYMIGSLSDEKEKGKQYLVYAFWGLIAAFLPWIGINWLQDWMTS